MYILSGKFKGKKLAGCKTKAIRPAMALIRKSIFDTLKDFVIDSSVLDLCAGTGILGIEAISRGAKNLTLVDSDISSVKLIKKNLDLCNLDSKVIISYLPKGLNKLKNEKFNLVFLDPPYGNSIMIEKTLSGLVLNKLIENDGLVFIESEEKSKFIIPKELKSYKEKRFGNTKITILSCSL